MSRKVWIYILYEGKYELRHNCKLSEKFKSNRFEELKIDLSQVDLIEE